MDKILLLAHAARVAVEETKGKRSPFRWTDEERAAVTAFGRAIKVPEDMIRASLDQSEGDEEAHQSILEQFYSIGELEAVLGAERAAAE